MNIDDVVYFAHATQDRLAAAASAIHDEVLDIEQWLANK